MNELFDGTRTLIGLAGILPFALFKMFGGRQDQTLQDWHIPFRARIWKRFISSIYLGCFLCAFSLWRGSFHWLYLLSIPLYIVEAYIDGYGWNGPSVFMKVLRRIISGLLFASVALIFAILAHKMSWWIMQTLIGVIIMVGTQFQEGEKAPSEETIIHYIRTVLKPFFT